MRRSGIGGANKEKKAGRSGKVGDVHVAGVKWFCMAWTMLVLL